MAQTSNSHLLFQYFGTNENQSELNYISWVLESNNLTIPGPAQEEAIMKSHEFYLSHKEEIDMKIKAEELIQFRAIVKENKAAMWSQALSSMASSLATGIAAGSAAASAQQEEYQKKLNRNNEVLAYISQNSSSTPKQYTQNFGSTPIMTNSTSRPRVTTSNGYDEPLPSTPMTSANNSQSTTYNESTQTSSNFSKGISQLSTNISEKTIQAVYVQGNQLVSCRLRFMAGKIWAYSTSKDALNRENWNNFYPDTPSPTMPVRDGNNARDYKYTISGAGMKFYFNM